MMRPTSPRERRLIALLILTGAVAAIYSLIVAPVLDGFRARAMRRDALMLSYLHDMRTIAAIPRLRRQAELQKQAAEPYRIDVRTVEAGREWLKDRLQTAVERAGGTFREGGDGEGRPDWARARVSARLTLPQLIGTLARLQNDPPWLVVEFVTVTANDALVTGRPSQMDVDIEVSIPLRLAAARPDVRAAVDARNRVGDGLGVPVARR